MKSFPTCDKEVNISVLFGSEELNPISSPHTWEFWDTESYDEQWGGGGVVVRTVNSTTRSLWQR